MVWTVYHSCLQDGGKDEVLKNGPFHCDTKRTHWLTNGYYFWRGLECAKKWGRDSYCADGNYAIIKGELNIEESELLDLVSNEDQMIYFRKLLSQFMNHCRKELGGHVEPTVSGALEFTIEKAKKNGVLETVFPYIAVMAAENVSLVKTQTKFVEGRENTLSLNNRIQMCLFTGYEERIKNKYIVYPETWEDIQES